jgi:hypothetical protein
MSEFDGSNVFTSEPEDTQSDTSSEESRAEESKPKSRPSRRVIKKANITPQAVEAVLEWKSRVDQTDAKTLDLAADLLSVKRDDEAKFISALMDSSAVSAARKTISNALDLAALDDLKFAVEVSKIDRNDRKDLWNLESHVDPDLANSLTDGSGKLPTNDLYAEVSVIRRLQKESPEFREALDAVTALLG